VIVEKTETFNKWLKALKDKVGRARIVRRIQRIEVEDFFGDCEKLQDCDLFELRIHYGPGYRVYFEKRENTVVFVLRAGLKKDQKADIQKAKKQAREN
jgi:putative addiction module killer protein